jgi:hypothetical protein
MDRLDIISFLATSYLISWLTDISGTELVAMQLIWFGALWIGKRLIDRWIDRKYA